MKTRLADWVAVLLAAGISLAAHAAAPMYMPVPIGVPNGVTVEQASKAIQRALVGRTWKVEEVNLAEDGVSAVIVGSLYVRVHSLTIRFEVNAREITIHYVKSTNLRYEEDGPNKLIHPKYTQWIKNLELDIAVEFAKLDLK